MQLFCVFSNLLAGRTDKVKCWGVDEAGLFTKDASQTETV